MQIRVADGGAFDPARSGLEIAVPVDAFRPTEWVHVYAREGVEHLWLVDLAERTLQAFELREGEWALVASAKDDEQVGIRPFEAIKVSLGELRR